MMLCRQISDSKGRFPGGPQVIKGYLPTGHPEFRILWLLHDVLAAPGILGSPRH